MSPHEKPTQSPSPEAAASPVHPPSVLPRVPTASWEAVRKLKEANPAVEYRPYPHAPTYIVGSDGTILNTFKSRKLVETPHQLKQYKNPKGYLCVSLFQGASGKTKRVHTVVLETYVSDRPFKKEAAHNDGVRTNNRDENLRWATSKENKGDKIKHGTHQYGEGIKTSKLTESQVLMAVKMRNEGISFNHISKIMKVNRSTIHDITTGHRWGLVTGITANPNGGDK